MSAQPDPIVVLAVHLEICVLMVQTSKDKIPIFPFLASFDRGHPWGGNLKTLQLDCKYKLSVELEELS